MRGQSRMHFAVSIVLLVSAGGKAAGGDPTMRVGPIDVDARYRLWFYHLLLKSSRALDAPGAAKAIEGRVR